MDSAFNYSHRTTNLEETLPLPSIPRPSILNKLDYKDYEKELQACDEDDDERSL